LKVIVDASNGMAGRWLPLLFGDIDWLEIGRLNFEHNGEFMHNPDPLAQANLEQLKDRMSRSKADLGICFDGDADRLVCVDEKGSTIPADLMTALLARTFLARAPGSMVVYDLRSSRVVAEEVREAGGIPRRERCGHAFIKKMLADTKGIFAGEVSGHYYFRENFYCDSGMIAFAEIVNVLTSTGKPISDLVAPLRRYRGSGELNFCNDDPRGTLKRLAARYSDGEIDYLDGVTVQYKDWWFNVRPSHTEPLLRMNLEAATDDLLKKRLSELCPMLGTPAKE
jgi:phosphomannomutase